MGAREFAGVTSGRVSVFGRAVPGPVGLLRVVSLLFPAVVMIAGDCGCEYEGVIMLLVTTTTYIEIWGFFVRQLGDH